MHNLSPGMIVDRKYKVEKILGEGGMGLVWLCRDIVTDVPVVLKAIRSDLTHLKDYRDRILAEGRALARIDHPNVVRLNAVVVEENEVCLVMQYIEGESLDVRIARNLESKTAFEILEVMAIFRQIVSGVSAAHAEGIIHRDLKPANILVRAKDGMVKVTDFGIAKEESDAREGVGKTTGVIGSIRYMAPEQCRGQKDLDKRVDIYALGILLFELLTGTRPFDGTGFELMSKHVHDPLPSLSARRADVPQWLENIVRRCTEKQRELRYGSCEELLAQIPADLQARVNRTVPGTPMIEQAQPTTVPAMPAVVDAPRIPMPSNVTAPASTLTSSPSSAPAPRRGPLIVATILASIAFGLGASYGLGWFGPERTHSPPSAQRGPSTGTHHSGATTTTPPGKSPLAALQGAWKSNSGREYDAVVVGEVLEMRIHDVKPFVAQGYEPSETRLLLRLEPGKTDSFLVEDRLRPNAPTGSEYDPARARLTCLVPFSEIDGKPLEARLENGQLHIAMVLIKPETSHYMFDGKLVTGCRNLLTASVSPIESVLSRP